MPNKYLQLQKIEKQKNEVIDKNVNIFINRLEKIYPRVERRLNAMLARYAQGRKLDKIDFEFALLNKRNIESVLVEEGYYKFAGEFVSSQQQMIDKIAEEYRLFGYKSKIGGTSRVAINELMRSNYEVIEKIGKDATDKLYTAIFQGLVTDKGLDASMKTIQRAAETHIGEKIKNFRTVADTEYMKFNRGVMETISGQTGWDKRVYTGPVDNVIRPFCLERVGNTYTIDEISRMKNGQTDNVLLTGGGFNCRHSWVAVPDDFDIDSDIKQDLDEAKKKARE
jgi:hypothetical protein